MTSDMRKKYAPKPVSATDPLGCLRCPAGGRDIIYLCDVIDELEGILRDIQRSSTVDVDNAIERRLLAAMTRKT